MRHLILTATLSLLATAALAEIPATAPLFGGVVTTTEARAFETLLTPQGVRVFFYTDELAPASVEKATGTAKLKLPDGRVLDLALTRREPTAGEPTSYFCPMHPAVVRDKPGKCDLCGGMVLYVQDHLFGPADLAGVDLSKVSAMVRVTGMRGGEKEATFAPAFSTPDKKAGSSTTGSK